MATVALVGADGAGKTTIGRRLEQEAPVPVRYLYLGVNAEASNVMLPTTRLVRWVKRRRDRTDDAGPPPSIDAIVARRAGRRGPVAAGRAAVRLVNRLADEWYRQLVARRLERRGAVVVFDRHYLADYMSHDIDPGTKLPFDRRLHGLALRRLYPRPDVVVFLDAPAEVLLARKGEGTIEDLERRRRDYLAVEPYCREFVRVDASAPLDDVYRTVERVVTELATSTSGRGRR